MWRLLWSASAFWWPLQVYNLQSPSIESKLSRFYLAFENHNCPDYITEKFFNVIRTRKMIPIVMGASKEAYNLFGPEVKVNALENIVTFYVAGILYPCGWLWRSCRAWSLPATAQEWFGSFRTTHLITKANQKEKLLYRQQMNVIRFSFQVEYNKFFEWQGTGYHYNTRTMCRLVFSSTRSYVLFPSDILIMNEIMDTHVKT